MRGAAVWALSRLLPREDIAEIARHSSDSDETVRSEWTAALV